MTTFMIDKLESRIDNTLELSSICRGEWCRALESDIDVLEGVRERAEFEATPIEGKRLALMGNKITAAYRNLGPDIHV
jgi:hypothetical protein